MGSGGRVFAEKRHLPRKRGKRGADWEKADWQTGQGLLPPLGEAEEAGRREVAHQTNQNAFAQSQHLKEAILNEVLNLAFAKHLQNPKALLAMNENEYLQWQRGDGVGGGVPGQKKRRRRKRSE